MRLKGISTHTMSFNTNKLMRQEMLYYPHFAEKEPNMNRECQSQDLNQHFRALEPPY